MSNDIREVLVVEMVWCDGWCVCWDFEFVGIELENDEWVLCSVDLFDCLVVFIEQLVVFWCLQMMFSEFCVEVECIGFMVDVFVV